MRKPVFLFLLLLFPLGVFSMTNTIRAGWGGLQPRYYYPQNDIEWNGTGIFVSEAGMEAGVRSFGTFYFFSLASYDFHVLLQYRFLKLEAGQISWENSVLAGGGYFLYIRKEAAGYGGFYPEVLLRSQLTWLGLYVKADVPVKLYADGFSLGVFPEAGWFFGWFGIYIRSEPLFTAKFDFSNSEWSWNNTAGLLFRF